MIAGVGETVEDVGKAVAWLGEGGVAFHDDCFAFRSEMNPTFVAYAMQPPTSTRRRPLLCRAANSSDCPPKAWAGSESPYPTAREQDQIVETLNAFDSLVNDLSIGLPAELAARRKQYEHYRDRLLTFPEART